MNGSVALSSDELNFVVYRYLMESGGLRAPVRHPPPPRLLAKQVHHSTIDG